MMSAHGGGTPKAAAIRKLSKGGYVKMQMGEGVKRQKKCRHQMYMAPLRVTILYYRITIQ